MKGKSCWLVMGEQLFYLSFDEFREWGVVVVRARVKPAERTTSRNPL